MRVLVGCECSGVIREAFRARGHQAWSCDLVPAEDGSVYHLKGNLLAALVGWDLIIAHPPCKYLSVSGMHWTTRGFRDPQETVKAIAFAEAIWNCGCLKICIENPTSVLSTRSCLGKPADLVQPYEFGHDASKSTRLWLKGLSPLRKTGPYIQPRMVCKCGRVFLYAENFQQGCSECGPGHAKSRWANQCDSGQNKLSPGPSRSADRARTYPGIAKAMAEQWG